MRACMSSVSLVRMSRSWAYPSEGLRQYPSPRMISLTCCRPPVSVYRICGLSPSAPQCESVQSDSMAVACAWAARLTPIDRGWRPASMRASLISRRT